MLITRPRPGVRAFLLACGLLSAAAAAAAMAQTPPAPGRATPVPDSARQKLAGLPVDCQKAYASMRACLDKTLAAGAPDSIRPPWEKQLDDTLTSWQAMKGQPGVLQLCRDIAAKPDCEE